MRKARGTGIGPLRIWYAPSWTIEWRNDEKVQTGWGIHVAWRRKGNPAPIRNFVWELEFSRSFIEPRRSK